MVTFGAIADDFTGATDLAGNWHSRGLRTCVVLDVPKEYDPGDFNEYDAIVVAQKTRSVAVELAVTKSTEAFEFLTRLGVEQIYQKYCSTFDSTASGNIGPIADRLLALTESSISVIVPAFPDNGRTVYQGNLFVGSQLLSESSMRNHPLNPMTDSNLIRLMEAQSQHSAGLVDKRVVDRGHRAIREALDELADEGNRFAVVDAVSNQDLDEIFAATRADHLVTGGSGLALGHELVETQHPPMSKAGGFRAILSGSASVRTQEQVKHAKDLYPSHKLDLSRLHNDFDAEINDCLEYATVAWASKPETPVMIYSVETLEDVEAARSAIPNASELIEHVFATLAARMASEGARKFIVAGGETSGSVVDALGIELLELGTRIGAGVSWLAGSAPGGLHNVVLKSGNFGSTRLFSEAWEQL